MNIVIINSVSLNGGDAAILESLLASIRAIWSGARITVLDSHAEAAARYFPQTKFQQGISVRERRARGPLAGKRRWLQRRVSGRARLARLLSAALLLRQGLNVAARALCSDEEFETLTVVRDAELVISTGGTYLVPTYQVEQRLAELTLAHAFGVPLVLYTQSIGDFSGGPSEKWMRFCLERAALVLLRDEQSLRNVQALGLDGTNCFVCPDSVFSMAEAAALVEPRRMPERGLDVVVSVRDWSHFQNGNVEGAMSRYLESVAAAATWLVRERDARVRFVSTCQGVPEYQYDDSAIANRVLELVPHPYRANVLVEGHRRTPDQLIEEYGKADLVIATRMHAAILALCAGTTVLPIAYEFKTEELFRELGLADWLESIDLVTPFSLTQRVQLVLREATERRATVAAAVMRNSEAAAKALRRVPALLTREQRYGAPAEPNWLWARVSPEEGFE